jgi:hypothetical protein
MNCVAKLALVLYVSELNKFNGDRALLDASLVFQRQNIMFEQIEIHILFEMFESVKAKELILESAQKFFEKKKICDFQVIQLILPHPYSFSSDTAATRKILDQRKPSFFYKFYVDSFGRATGNRVERRNTNYLLSNK